MAFISIILLVCVADYTLGTECKEGQHCPECDMDGDCLQGCDKGYFGKKCSSQCNIKCRYNTCKLDPDTGAGKCTHGCVLGYQGTSCDRPCDSHVVNCTLCPGGCDEGYCQLGDTCFAGCRDSLYGSGCKTCPSTCRTCNRMTGVCDECDTTHYGVNCEKSCENCAGACAPDCECVSGFYGGYCAETCSKTCRPKSAHKCHTAVTSDSCTGECDKHNATCLHGCVDGWFGPRCSSQCNPGCRHQRCNAVGSCSEGCELHHFGSACKPCPENCTNRTCHPQNGSCVDGCKDGFNGQDCSESCTLCPRGVCDQNSGACVDDCSVSEEGSVTNCTRTCSRRGCSTGYSNSDRPKRPHMSTATLTIVVSAVTVLLVASSVCGFCFRKRTCAQRSAQAETGTHSSVLEQVDPKYMDYQEVHKYWEIGDDETELGDGIPNQNHDSTSDVIDDALPVLAEYFPGDVDIEAGDDNVIPEDGAIEAKGIKSGQRGSAVSDDDSYTHLTSVVPVGHSRKVASYISPIEN
ncbi:protein draper-like [Haliotis asinina]|uniref:protein draper-like n=1 Tax=Haliotis asinina TaxID=109174 RepID=UPI0035319926